jgi:hypothetical protein
MKKLNHDRLLIEKHQDALSGVISNGDLEILLNEPNHNQFFRRIRALESENIIQRFVRGFYTTKSYDPRVLSQKIAPDSYLSCTTILAQNLVIGIRPTGLIESIGQGRTRVHKREDLTIKIYGLKQTRRTGVFTKGSIAQATSERAFLDCLYLHQHGNKFLFDIYSDVNISLMQRERVLECLQDFKNPKFRRFVLEVLNATS